MGNTYEKKKLIVILFRLCTCHEMIACVDFTASCLLLLVKISTAMQYYPPAGVKIIAAVG